MPLDQKDAFEYLGFKEMPESMEDFRKSFDQSYIKKSSEVIKQDEEFYGKLMGEKTGVITTKFKRGLKEAGIELSDSDIKDKKTEEVITLGLKKAHEFYSGKIAELESQAGKGNDELVTDLKNQLEKTKSKYNDTKGLLDTLTQEHEKFKADAASQIKGVKRQVKFGEALKSIKWKTGVKDIEKEGYFSTFDKEFKVDLDDNDNIEVFDKSGKRVTSTKESGKFISLEEALEMHGRKVDVWETNPHPERGRVMPANITQLGQPVAAPANGQPMRRVAAAARNNEGR